MITEEQYKKAVEQEKEGREIINQYFREKDNRFKERLETGEPFTDEELFYSRYQLCPCGHGLAYPKDCGPGHYWDCSAVLKGEQDILATHTARLPFTFYDIKGERGDETTRGLFIPQDAAQ